MKLSCKHYRFLFHTFSNVTTWGNRMRILSITPISQVTFGRNYFIANLTHASASPRGRGGKRKGIDIDCKLMPDKPPKAHSRFGLTDCNSYYIPLVISMTVNTAHKNKNRIYTMITCPKRLRDRVWVVYGQVVFVEDVRKESPRRKQWELSFFLFILP